MAPASLLDLYLFDAVATAGGLRAAAARLGRSPAALGRAVAALERALGAPLVERAGRGLALSRAGMALRPHAALVTAELLGAFGRCGPPADPEAIAVLFNEQRLRAALLLAHLHAPHAVALALDTSRVAVEQGLARLEIALGQPLFRPGARGVVATAFGRRCLGRFARVLDALADCGRMVGPNTNPGDRSAA